MKEKQQDTRHRHSKQKKLHSEITMWSEIIMQLQQDMSEPQPQFKQRNKTNNCFHENLNFLI